MPSDDSTKDLWYKSKVVRDKEEAFGNATKLFSDWRPKSDIRYNL